MPTALVLLAEGAEEMETVITVDVLRRGEVRDLFFKKKGGVYRPWHEVRTQYNIVNNILCTIHSA